MDQPIEVGPYRVLRPLGEGGMAETFVAERTGPGGFVQRVCLKRVRPGMERDAEFVRQFMAEARIMAALQHSTIVQVLDFGEDAGTYYLALELVEGLDLRQLLDATGPLDVATVLHLAVQLATALDIAHRSDVVHRDVSPSNVLLSADGEVRLTDFGIARAMGETVHTRTGIVKGKFPYMAPEYVGSGQLDARGDLFGLGVLLYECLVGRRPYDGATEMETLARAATGRFTSLREALGRTLAAGGYEEALFACVEQMLAPDPDTRQQSAADVLHVLTRLPVDGQAARRIGELVRDNRRADIDDAMPGAANAAEGPNTSGRGGDTAPLSPSERPPSSPVPSAPSARPRTPLRAWLAVGAIGLTAGLVGGLWALTPPNPQPPGTPAAVATPAPPTAPERPTPPQPQPATNATVTDGGPGRSADAGPRDGDETARSSATLTVVVIPYGDVTIDGRARGKAPIRVELRAGKHEVVAHMPGRVERRQVTLDAGGSRRLVIR